jgi:hypothetical protein
MREWNEDVRNRIPFHQEITPKTISDVGTERIRVMLPYARFWADAMKIGAKPENFIATSRIVWSTADLILTQAGEVYNPLTFHARRSVICSLLITIESLISQNPSQSEEYLKYFSSAITQIARGENTLTQLLDLNRFFLEAHASMFLSFYPQPSNHSNPFPGYEHLKNNEKGPLEKIWDINKFFLEAHWSMISSFAIQPTVHQNPIPGSENYPNEGGVMGELASIQKLIFKAVSGLVPTTR